MKEEAEAFLPFWNLCRGYIRLCCVGSHFCVIQNKCGIISVLLTKYYCIASNESFDRTFAKCGLTDDMVEVPLVKEFNLVHQVTMQIYPDIVGLLVDENRHSSTIRLGLSDTTIATSKKTLFAIINYLSLLGS